MSNILTKILFYIRRINELTSQLKEKINDCLYLNSRIKTLTIELSCLQTENKLLKEIIKNKEENENKSIAHANSVNIQNSINIDNSVNKTIDNTVTNNTLNNSVNIDKAIITNVTLNLFGHENIDYIHVPDYLTHTSDIVRLVQDVHFNKEHPENHNVGLDDDIGTIYDRSYKNGKIEWKMYTKVDTLSELIQNGERIMITYNNPLDNIQQKVVEDISEIIGKYTNWNCLTEQLSSTLHDIIKNASHPPKLME
jgi:hypothetical protein